MKTLIVGYGSMGKLHARILRPLSDTLGIVTAQEASEYPLYRSFEEALADLAPDYVVIGTVTPQHAANLTTLKSAGFRGKALIEKPVFNSAQEYDGPYPFTAYVGYHLRFHKVMVALKEALAGRKILSASAYAGQQLSLWWPGVDPKTTYSAHRQRGGGVMRDLSHELDLAQFLFGRITASQGKADRVGTVTVDSEDRADFELVCERCPKVHVHLNYLDETPRREWVIETDKGSIVTDLIRRTITVDEQTRTIACGNDDAYRAMHQAVLKDGEDVCTLEEALQVVKIIDTVTMPLLKTGTA